MIWSKHYKYGITTITKWTTMDWSRNFNLWPLCLMRLSPSSLWKNEYKTSTSSIGSIRNIFTATISLWLHQPPWKGEAAGSLSRYSTAVLRPGLSPLHSFHSTVQRWLSQAPRTAFFKHLPPPPVLVHFFNAIPGRKAMKASSPVRSFHRRNFSSVRGPYVRRREHKLSAQAIKSLSICITSWSYFLMFRKVDVSSDFKFLWSK